VIARVDTKALTGAEDDAALQERLWPSAEQRLLLKAALADGAEARDAYLAWRSGIDLEADFAWSVLRLLPPYVVTEAEVAEGMDILSAAIHAGIPA